MNDRSLDTSISMIVSVHVPKTAGQSFGHLLDAAFGARVLADYGDWPESASPEARAHDAQRRAAMVAQAAALAERYDAIHGHFVASKYAGVFPVTALVAMVRDPYQHALSTYEHAERSDVIDHPALHRFKDERMNAVELIRAIPDHQSIYFRDVPLEQFAMIGITEEYPRAVALFGAIFGITMPQTRMRRNVNPAKHAERYEVTPEVREAVNEYRAGDLLLYRRARERFETLCAKHGI